MNNTSSTPLVNIWDRKLSGVHLLDVFGSESWIERYTNNKGVDSSIDLC